MSAASPLSFERVSVDYATPKGLVHAVDDVSLTLRPGEFVSLLGPSGCGKTSLLKLAAGLTRASAGRVTSGGREITGPGPDRGVILQEYGVFPWLTVEQNIAFGLGLRACTVPKESRGPIVERYLDLMGLRDFRHALPKMLSGGMKQRVAIARAYVVRPELLLMDEPFGALDPQTRLVMQDLLLAVLQREGGTVLLITHSVEEALYLSSRVAVISARPGRIRAVVDVPFPFPRSQALLRDLAFNELKAELMELVMREYAVQARLTDRLAG
ncbi:MAG: ABC transporter ATP-binding protein [Geminicoccaceae bacterium]